MLLRTLMWIVTLTLNQGFVPAPVSQTGLTREELSASSPDAIVFWHTLSLSQARVLQQITADFSRETGIPVQLETGMNLGHALIKQKLRGALPDVILGAADLVALTPDVDLAPIPPTWLPPTINPRFFKELALDSILYGIPLLAGNHLMLFTNTAIAPAIPISWEELIKQQEDLSKRKISTLALPVGEPYYFLPIAQHFSLFANGQLHPDFGKGWTHLTEALEFYAQLVERGVVPKHCSFTCPTTGFYSGQFAHAISGDWAFAEAQTALGDKLRVSPLPSLRNRPMHSISSTQALFFPGNSLAGSRKTALKRLALHLLNTNQQVRLAETLGRIPVTEPAMLHLSENQLTQAHKSLLEIFHNSIVLRPTRETTLTWHLLRKALAFQLHHVAPTPRIIDFLETQTLQRLRSYGGSNP